MGEVFDYYGSKLACSKALGVSAACVSQWIDRGEIPARRGVQIERETNGAFRAVLLADEIEGIG